MSTQKHTPGPWKWDSEVWAYDPQEEAPWLVSSDSEILKGEITCGNKADVLLIASAPELLKALEVIARDILPMAALHIETLDRVDLLVSGPSPQSRALEVYWESEMLLNAAIAKATGEE